MAGLFDHLVPGEPQPKPSGGGLFDHLVPQQTKGRDAYLKQPAKIGPNGERLYNADNPPYDDDAFIAERQNVGGTEYRRHAETGEIYGPDNRPTADLTVLEAFGKAKPTKVAQRRIDANAAMNDQSSAIGDLRAGWENLKGIEGSLRLYSAAQQESDYTRAEEAMRNAGAGPEQLAYLRRMREQSAGAIPGAAADVNTAQQAASAIPQAPAAARFDNAKTWGEAFDAFLSDPLAVSRSTAFRSAPASMPSVVGGILGSIVGPGGAAGGAGFGSGIVELGSGIQEGLQEYGARMDDPTSILQVWKKHGDEIKKKAYTRAAIIGSTDALTGGISSKIAANPTSGFVRKQLTGTGVQMAGGAGGELAAQVATGEEIKPGAVLGEALGEVVFGAGETAGQIAVNKAMGRGALDEGGAPPPVTRETLEEQPAEDQTVNRAAKGDAQRTEPRLFDHLVPPAPGTARPAPGFGTGETVQTNGAGTKSDKATITTPQDMEAIRPIVNTEPTPAQAEAGNYQKAHVKFQGFDIAIENPKGSVRRGTDPDGKTWESPPMLADYGYIKGRTGKDGDKLDVLIGPDANAQMAYVIDQNDLQTGKFDEHKTVIGASTPDEAIALYEGGFSDGRARERIGAVTPMTIDQFRDWVKNGSMNKPASANWRPAQAANVAWEDTAPMAPRTPKPQPTAEHRKAFNNLMASKEGVSIESLAARLGGDERMAGQMISRALAERSLIQTRTGKIMRPPRRLKPVSFLEWIAANGGMRDEGGELKSRDLTAGRSTMTPYGPWVRPNGLSPEKIMKRAIEDGFIRDPSIESGMPSDITEQAVYDLIDQQVFGKKVYRDEDQTAARAIQQKLAEDMANPDAPPTTADIGWQMLERRFGPDVADEIMGAIDIMGVSVSKAEMMDAGQNMTENGMTAEDALEAAIIRADENALEAAREDPDLRKLLNDRDRRIVEAWAIVLSGRQGTPVVQETPQQKAQPDEAEARTPPSGSQPDTTGERGQDAEDQEAAQAASGEAPRPRPAGQPQEQVEPGADDKPQTVLPGAEQATAEDVKKAKQKDRAEKELEVRRKQSKMRKGNQQAVQDQTGGLFSDEADQTDLLQAPKPETDFDRKIADTKYTNQPAAVAKDGRAYRIKKDGEGFIAIRMTNERGKPNTYLRPPKGTVWTESEAIEAINKAIADAPKPAATVKETPPADVQPVTISTLADVEDAAKRFRKGDMTAAEAVQAFEALQASRDAIADELNKKTKPELEKMRGMRRPGDKKAEIVQSVMNSLMSSFVASGGISYNPFDKDGFIKGVKSAMAKQTDEDIQNAAEQRKKRTAEMLQTYTDPQTVEQFQSFIRLRGANALTPEQRIRYDEMVAERTKSTKTAEQSQKAEIAKVDTGQATLSDVIETKHTQKGHDLYVVKLSDRVERDVYDRLNTAAKRLGGRYSSYAKGGAIPGFQFTTRDNAEKFRAVSQENVSIAETQAERKEVTKDSAVQRLRSMADEMTASAEAALSQGRNTNTARRARMAEAAESEARKKQALAETMRNLADAMEDGNVKHLDGIRTRMDVQTLESLVRNAKYYWINEQQRTDKSARYSDLENKPVTAEMINFAPFPYPSIHREHLSDIAEALSQKPGSKRVAAELAKMAQSATTKDVWQVKAKDKATQDLFRKAAKDAKDTQKAQYAAKTLLESFADFDRVNRMGLENPATLRTALREFLDYRKSAKGADPIKKLERELIGTKIEGYFPTPKRIVDDMIERADLRPGQTILEPSAGKGNIADNIVASVKDAALSVIEPVSTLRKILELKGHNLVDTDFTQHTGTYDRIIMNPPFENGQDIDHVRHAYDLLKPGGRVVAIMSEGPFFRQDRKATEFRDWLDRLGGVSEKLPDGSFKDSERSTGVATRMVVIDKSGVLGSIGARGADVTQTKAFKDWFGDSKVVDQKGKPLVVYHGSPDARFMKDTAVFSTLKQRMSGSDTGGVFWFAKDRRVAGTYADDRRAFDYQNAEPSILPVYLSLQNPLIVDANGKAWREAQARGRTTDVIEQAQAAGHDGIIIRNVRDNYQSFAEATRADRATDTYAVFSSTQIKSVFNNGQFSPTNPSILGSIGSRPPPVVVTRKQVVEANVKAQALARKYLGHGVRVEVVAKMPDFVPPEYLAAFNPSERAIYVSMKVAHDMSFMLGHEGIHFLKNIGAITETEWKTLRQEAVASGYALPQDVQDAYRESYVDQYGVSERRFAELMDEEAVANMLGGAVAEIENAPPKARSILKKLIDYLNAILRLMRSNGIDTPSDVISRFTSGEFGRRADAMGPDAPISGPDGNPIRGNIDSRKPFEDVEASILAATGDAKAAKDLAGNINLRNLNTSEDIKGILKVISDKSAGFMSARRNVVSNDQTRQLAAELGMNYDELVKRAHGEAFNAHEIFASRVLLIKSAKRLASLAKQAKASGSVADLVQFHKAFTRHAAIQEQIAGMTAEAGRALQQFRMLAGDNYFKAAFDIVNAANTKASNREGMEAVMEMAQAVDILNDPAQIGKFTRKAYKITALDMIRELWINMILSGLRTQATNVLSNMITAVWQIPETAAAEIVGAFHGGTDKIRPGEARARLAGLIQGTREGLIVGAKAFRTGQPSDLISKIEHQSRKAIPGITGEIVRTPGRMLVAADEFFKTINYRAEINAQAIRHAYNEGLRGKKLAERAAEYAAQPTKAMEKAAHDFALYQTFQKELGTAGRHVMGLREATGIGWIILPFIRTPANILKYAGERTPLAFASPTIRSILKGEKGKAARDQQIARIMIGSAIMTATVAMAAGGMISGGGPDDPKEKSALYTTGWQPYSFKIGDTWYSYQRMDPWSFIVGIAADMVELGDAVKKADAEKVYGLILKSISNALINKTWLRGPADFFEAAMSTEPGAWERWGMGLAGSVVPTIVSHVAQQMDPTLREARSVVDKIKSRTPGLSKTLPARRDLFGEEIKLDGALGPDILSPIFTSVEKDDPVVRAMQDAGYFPSRPQRKINGHDLTGEQYSYYSEIAGKMAHERLLKIVTKPTWAKRKPTVKEETIRDVFQKARKFARAKVMKRYPELRKKPQ